MASVTSSHLLLAVLAALVSGCVGARGGCLGAASYVARAVATATGAAPQAAAGAPLRSRATSSALRAISVTGATQKTPTPALLATRHLSTCVQRARGRLQRRRQRAGARHRHCDDRPGRAGAAVSYGYDHGGASQQRPTPLSLGLLVDGSPRVMLPPSMPPLPPAPPPAAARTAGGCRALAPLAETRMRRSCGCTRAVRLAAAASYTAT